MGNAGEKLNPDKKFTQLAKLCLSDTAYVFETEGGKYNLYKADRDFEQRFETATELQDYLTTKLNDKVFEVNAIIDDTPYEYVFHNGKERISLSWEDVKALKKMVEAEQGIYYVDGVRMQNMI